MRPFIQQLEDRVMLSTLLVNNPTDAHVADETSLREAIVQANTDAAAGISDTIAFDSSLGSSTINLTQGQLELSGAGTITIDGSSPSTPIALSAAAGSRVFVIDSGVNAVLTNLTMQGGQAGTNSGGNIFNAGTLAVSNATLSEGSASYGGGIENQGTLTLSNVTLTNNSANISGGAIDSTGTLTVNDSTLTSNGAADGGAISSEGMLTVNNSTFSGNSATNSGGAIASFSAPATITGSILTGNNAAYGGVLENNAGTVTLTSDTLSNNTATTAGGAIENDSGPLTLNNTSIAGNMVNYGNGGGINNNAGTVTITNSTFSGNQVFNGTGSGGAMENSGGTVSASNSTFFDNSATASGGAIDNESGGNLSLTNATVSSNSADNGGGIENNGGTLSLQNTIVAGNYGPSGWDIDGVITTDNGNNLLGTAVNNTTTIPTPGPNDVFSDTPMLGTLADYGGPTQTLALLAGSPAIGAGNASATNPATDQRGLPRVVNGSLDIGAFQTQPPTLAFTTLGQTADAGQPTGAITVELEDLDGNPAPAGGTVGYSGNGTTADTTGGANLTLVGGAGFAAGQTGQALSLNGASQYAITPNLASLFANSDASVTVSLWFNASGPGVIMDELGQTALDAGWHDSQIEILANGTVEVRVWDLSAVALGTASFNAWHNVVLRYDAGTQTLDGFLDGVQSTSSTSGGRLTPYGSGYGLYYAFGATDTTNLGAGAYFNGLIQNISIFNRPLSNTDVQTLYGGGSGVIVTLSSSSTGGSFSYPNGLPITGGQIVIPQGASSFTFDYTDTQPGTPMLTASSAGFASATQQGTVLPAPISVTPQPSIVVGRVLSYYDVPDVQNNQDQLTITYTVYNEQADPETGVLLTDTLSPGETIVSSSVTLDGTTTAQLPDQSGQNLAWSLQPINGYDRESVAVTLNLPSPIPLQLDTGAQAFATLDAGAVSASTPAATLSPNAIDPNLLASTPDANTSDPFIQEEAAQLDYNAQNIFNFLHTQIGYNSYTGSLRGARGTLWSNAGNALDVASLGVALMRASGIPAQYVSGTLSQSDAQELILSMFPNSFQTVGYIPAGTQTADSANDPQLLSETESHYWFQFDTGSGMTYADPLMPGATIGQTFTTSTGTFTEVPDALRQKTTIQLNAEIMGTLSALAGPQANTTTVLNQTFNDVDLVGRPLTIGNFVNSSTPPSLFISVTTNTYSPYIDIGDEAYPDGSHDEIIEGTPYQEVLTNFPLASQILTGLFLNVTLSGPGGPTETYEQTLVDRIGYAVRQSGGSPSLSIDTNGPPIITPFDLTTLNILPGLQSPGAAQLAQEWATQELASISSESNPTQVAQAGVLIAIARAELANFAVASDQETANLESGFSVAAYFSAPRITAFSSQVVTANNQSTISFSVNLLHDSIRAVASPGQNVKAPLAFASARGLFDSVLEAQTVPNAPGAQNLSSATIIEQSMQQGIPLAVITASNLSLLQGLNLPADAIARITTNVQNGLTVIVPTQALTVNGTQTTAWFNYNPTTGEMIAESQDGDNQALIEFVYAQDPETEERVLLGFRINLPGVSFNIPLTAAKGGALQIADILLTIEAPPGTPSAQEILELLKPILNLLGLVDPPTPPLRSNLQIPYPDNLGTSAVIDRPIAPSANLGSLNAKVQLPAVTISKSIAATWMTSTESSFSVYTFNAAMATILDANGNTVGTGAVVLNAANPAPTAISGNDQYNVNGLGSLSFYGPSESSLGVSCDWQNYTATVTGNVSITLTVSDGALTLNGQSLPAGTYTITTNSATLSGSGSTSSPNFAGSASITATGSTINLGPGSGSLSVGGTPLDPEDETTVDGYNGTISVSANGGGTDSVNLNGTAGNVLQVAVSPATFTTDQNIPITFQPSIQTSLADTYNLTASAPPGWTVTIDDNGNVTATPAPGLQSGTYPIQIIAQSQTDTNLEAQTTVEVTITPTQPGVNVSVVPDPVFTVPYDGAQLPTAFRAVIQNLGPTADTYNLTFSNVPSGFTLLNSGTTVTIPAGQTGIVGLYLQPNPGQPIPPPGTQVSFTVTATSTTESSITKTQTETFTVPEIDAVTLTNDPSSVNTTPGTPVADTITLANAGNVPETVSLAATLPSGLTASALTPVTLAVGQSTTETITLTPDASTPLNSTLDATITATFGPSGSPQTQTVQIPVSVGVPGAAAIADAAVAAGQLGNTNLADRLNDLSIALTNSFQNPTSQVYMSQSLASLDAVINLLTTDPYLGTFALTLAADGAALAQATTAGAIRAALAQLGTDLGTVGTTLTDEAAHGFNFTLLTNSQVGQPQVAKTYGIVVQNTGSQMTTYDLSLSSGVPSGVTASLSQTSVTLAPGQATSVSGAVTNLSVTITSNSTTQLDAFTFTVQATAEGATEISRTTTGSFTARTAVVQVVSVTPNPAFTNPGGQVDVSARILNAVNQQQQAEVSYTVTDPSGNVVFTSQPVAITLNVLSTLTPADLGNLDTTSFADGEFTINVTVTDSSGNPIPGATGQGSLLVGSPVTATLASSPAMLPAGNGTVTNTLQINSSLATGWQFTLEGQTPISGGASTVAIYGQYAYVGESNGIDIVDVSNPADPSVVSTFGSSDFPGGSAPVTVHVSGDDLLVDAVTPSNSTFLIYSLTNPTSPQPIGSTILNYGFAGDTGFVIQNNNAYLSQEDYSYFFGGTVYAQNGDLFSVDFSNPSSPSLVGSLYGLSTGGNSFVYSAAVVNSNTLLVASTTSTRYGIDEGVGQVLVVDTSDPSNPKLLGTVDIPGTIHLQDIAIDGNQAVVIGSSGGLSGAAGGFPGNLVLATLDLTNPQNPTLISTQTFSIPYNAGAIASLGNDLYIASNSGSGSTSSALLLIDARNPSNIQVTPFDVANAPNDDEVSGNLLYTTSSDGLLIYNIAPLTSAAITAQVTVPTNNGVSIDASSFSIAPTSITTNSNNTETLEWDLDLPLGNSSQTITWQSDVTGLQPGQSLTVDQGATVQFTDQGTPGTLTLPAQFVAGEQIIGLSPPTQAVAPAAPATYDVTLLNPTNSQVTYDLSVQGVPASWVNLPASVTVAANGSDDVPLVLTSDSFAALADYGFTITANGDNGASASVLGDLVLQGQPVLPDPESHGIVATLTSTQATAGQGTSAQYVVQLTNTGSADDTFSLEAVGLPVGVAASFGQTTIDVPPGASNFRDVTLTLG